MLSRCPRRICCNPHIFTFCLIDGCIKTGLVEAFAESIGISLEEDQSGMEPCERQKRCVPGPFVPQLRACCCITAYLTLHSRYFYIFAVQLCSRSSLGIPH